MKAIQTLTLEGGPYTIPFEAQINALKNIRQLVYQTLDGEELYNEKNEIRLQRRVFSKVISCI